MAKISKQIYIYVLVVIGIVILPSCFKQPNYANTPQIKFNRVGLNNNEYYIPDSSTGKTYGSIYFDYQDGDGNLGLIRTYADSIRNDSVITYVTDSSFGTIHYRIPKYQHIRTTEIPLLFPEIPSKGTVDDISGTVEIKLNTIFDYSEKLFYHFFYNGKTKDTVSLLIWVIDRDSNVSNTIETPPIIINID